MKKITFFLILLISGSLWAQDPVQLFDEPGTWNYAYLNDANTKMYCQQFGMSVKEITDFKNKLDQMVNVLHRNPVMENPRGFDPAVESRPIYPHNFKKHPENYNYIGEMNFRFLLWYNSKGKKYRQTIEPPRATLYFNNIAILKRSAFNVSALSGNAGNSGAVRKTGDQRDPAEAVNDICRPMKIKEFAPGVILYDYAIVFTKPGKPLFLPCTVGEAYRRLITYYEAAIKEEPYYSIILDGIKEVYATLDSEQLSSPAYFGGTASGITHEKNNDPMMLFNNDFFDRSLPKSSIQAIVFPIDSDYFRKETEYTNSNLGFSRIHQFLHSLDYEAIAAVLD